MTEQFAEMTVLALRKFAKENGIKLPAGLDKQGIVDKIIAEYTTEASTPAAAVPAAETMAAEPAVTEHPIRRASIITDDNDEAEEDEPVLTVRNYHPAAPVSRPAVPAAAPAKQASSLGTISSKAPAFSMEGARAWHNPRSYNPAPTQSYARTQWSTKPVYPQESTPRVRPEEARTYPAAAPRTGFGPAQPQEAASESSFADRRPRSAEPAPLSAEAALQRDFAEREMYTAPEQSCESAEVSEVNGILDLLPSGCGFLRVGSLNPNKNDVFVPAGLIKGRALRQGDQITGKQCLQREGDRYPCLREINAINGQATKDAGLTRPAFEDLAAIYPKKKIRFADFDAIPSDVRVLDLVSPIGYGQRALLTIPAHAGKTTLLNDLAAAIRVAAPDAGIFFLLLDEKPEEITEAAEKLDNILFATAADQGAEMTVHACELALESAMRLCELKKNAILIVDSLDAVMNAYNCVAPQASRTISGTMSAYAMQSAKKFFAAARNTREGGSITIIAACDPAGSLLPEISNVANMNASLDKAMTAAGAFPPIDLTRCATRKAELMLTKQEAANIPQLLALRNRSTASEAIQQIAFLLDKARKNADLSDRLESLLKMLG